VKTAGTGSSTAIKDVLAGIRDQNTRLSGSLNCFLNWNVLETDKAVVLVRPFFLHNLYDRMYDLFSYYLDLHVPFS
jgi:hypothetical protein